MGHAPYGFYLFLFMGHAPYGFYLFLFMGHAPYGFIHLWLVGKVCIPICNKGMIIIIVFIIAEVYVQYM